MTEGIRADDALAIFVSNGNNPPHLVDDIVVHGNIFVMSAILLGIPLIEVVVNSHMNGFGAW